MSVRILFFVAGVCLLQLLDELPSALTVVGLVGTGVLLRIVSPLGRQLLWFAAGIAWAYLSALNLLADSLDPSLIGREHLLEGEISSLPVKRDRRWVFGFDIDRGSLEQGVRMKIPSRVRLSWYDEDVSPRVGQRWRLLTRLKPRHGVNNPGGFDYEGWLFREGMGATGYVRASPSNRLLGRAGARYVIAGLRQNLRDEIQSLDLDNRPLGVILALALGDRSGIDGESWEIFTRTGTNHLVAISGLHIGIIAGLVFLLARVLWSRSSVLVLRLPAQKSAAVLSLLAAGLYASLAGFSIPTRRAFFMLLMAFLPLLLSRTTEVWRVLAIALFLVVLLDPLSVLSPGFSLSFGAVAAILYGLGGRLWSRKGWWSRSLTQWVVAVALLPLLVVQFGRFSLVAPLVNLVAVPWFSLVIIPASLFGALTFPLLGGTFLSWLSLLLEKTLDCIETFSALSWAVWVSGALPDWTWGFAVIGVFLILSPRGIPGRWLGFVFLCPLFLVGPKPPEQGDVRFALLDVGQGLSVFVQTREHALVYDTGPSYSGSFDAGAGVVVPFLMHQGITELDTLIVSHGDSDHAGGVGSLMRLFPVQELLTGEPGRLEAKGARLCRAGMAWTWDSVNFRVLHPRESAVRSANNASCVISIENAAGRILLTGDIETEGESELLARESANLDSDILVVPHHGSAGSSSVPFVRATSPLFALFATGYRNRYRFPSQDIVRRWESTGAEVLNTASSGAILLTLHSHGGISGPIRTRLSDARYWTHRLPSR